MGHYPYRKDLSIVSLDNSLAICYNVSSAVCSRLKGFMPKPRDSQRSKLYRAERKALEGLPCDELRGLSVEECQGVIDDIVLSRWWERRYGPMFTPPRVKAGQGARWATARHHEHTIVLPLWARKQWVIVHELAHYAVRAPLSPYKDVASHGPEFAKEYLALVKRWIGADEAQKLKASFKEHRVKSRVVNK